MRLWSLHPKYLDTKGLLAAWREALLAQHVLTGKTKGYKNHPQLTRFKEQNNPVLFLNTFLKTICDEATARGYSFDRTKVGQTGETISMLVTTGQVLFEIQHLKDKLAFRDPKRLFLLDTGRVDLHPIFRLTDGTVEPWEKV